MATKGLASGACPRCDGTEVASETGVLGDLQPIMFIGMKPLRVEVVAYTCGACGYMEFYATGRRFN